MSIDVLRNIWPNGLNTEDFGIFIRVYEAVAQSRPNFRSGESLPVPSNGLDLAVPETMKCDTFMWRRVASSEELERAYGEAPAGSRTETTAIVTPTRKRSANHGKWRKLAKSLFYGKKSSVEAADLTNAGIPRSQVYMVLKGIGARADKRTSPRRYRLK